MVIGPRTGIIGGNRLPWRLAELRSSVQLADAFTLDEPPEGSDQHTGEGQLLLGDFAKWAEFLGALTGKD